MDLGQSKERLENLSHSLEECDKGILESRLRGLISAYPFDEYEFTLMFLSEKGVFEF